MVNQRLAKMVSSQHLKKGKAMQDSIKQIKKNCRVFKLSLPFFRLGVFLTRFALFFSSTKHSM